MALRLTLPEVVVVCLQHGAKRAAKRFLDAGVPTVVWLTADIISSDTGALAELFFSQCVSQLRRSKTLLFQETQNPPVKDSPAGSKIPLIENSSYVV